MPLHIRICCSNGYKFHSNYPNIIALRINDVIDYVYDRMESLKLMLG